MAKKRRKAEVDGVPIKDLDPRVKVGLNLRYSADEYEKAVTNRMGAKSRLRAVEQGDDEVLPEILPQMQALLTQFEAAEERLNHMLDLEVQHHPVFQWAMGVPGINKVMICRLIGLIPMYTPESFRTFSQLRTFTGITPGKNRRVKGEKSPFNGRLRVSSYIAFTQLLKVFGNWGRLKHKPDRAYAEIYWKWRYKYAERHGIGPKGAEMFIKQGVEDPWGRFGPYKQFKFALDKGNDGFGYEWPDGSERWYFAADGTKEMLSGTGPTKGRRPAWEDGRQYLASKNKLLDVFLCHLWQVWRTHMGWPIPELYVHGQLGHHMRYNIDDFHSPEASEKKIEELHKRIRKWDNLADSWEETEKIAALGISNREESGDEAAELLEEEQRYRDREYAGDDPEDYEGV